MLVLNACCFLFFAPSLMAKEDGSLLDNWLIDHQLRPVVYGSGTKGRLNLAKQLLSTIDCTADIETDEKLADCLSSVPTLIRFLSVENGRIKNLPVADSSHSQQIIAVRAKGMRPSGEAVWFTLISALESGVVRQYTPPDKNTERPFVAFVPTETRGITRPAQHWAIHGAYYFFNLVLGSWNHDTWLYMPSLPYDQPALAITIDDAPSVYTSLILEALAKHRVKATFFLIGSNILVHPEYTRMILASGHEIAHHMYDYDPVTRRTLSAFINEFQSTQTLMLDAMTQSQSELRKNEQNVVKGSPLWFRPPSGLDASFMRRYIKRAGYESVIGNLGLVDAKSVWPFHGLFTSFFKWQLHHLSGGDISVYHDSGDYRPSYWLSHNTATRAQRTVQVLEALDSLPETAITLTLSDLKYLNDITRAHGRPAGHHINVINDEHHTEAFEQHFQELRQQGITQFGEPFSRMMDDNNIENIYVVTGGDSPDYYKLEKADNNYIWPFSQLNQQQFNAETREGSRFFILFRTPDRYIGGRVIARTKLPWYYMFERSGSRQRRSEAGFAQKWFLPVVFLCAAFHQEAGDACRPLSQSP